MKLERFFPISLDVRYINKFLGILALEIWYRLFITKEIKDDGRIGNIVGSC